ncbi:hypothetical protein ECANGB1_792 [Enterospora canceri]|uniref:Uncharacterized protein n=1 Tax=Enterospora canceri TaxID=1081671 RepID=A0A1Y1S7J2_9MICR|nr:hypothetical protein ECANGB1_792 [Enterospora canceri]
MLIYIQLVIITLIAVLIYSDDLLLYSIFSIFYYTIEYVTPIKIAVILSLISTTIILYINNHINSVIKYVHSILSSIILSHVLLFMMSESDGILTMEVSIVIFCFIVLFQKYGIAYVAYNTLVLWELWIILGKPFFDEYEKSELTPVVSFMNDVVDIDKMVMGIIVFSSITREVKKNSKVSINIDEISSGIDTSDLSV